MILLRDTTGNTSRGFIVWKVPGRIPIEFKDKESTDYKL